MIPHARHRNKELTYERAKELRRRMPLAEHKLWEVLRVMRKGSGLKFRHQQPISPYIVDFICFSIKLVIELDGQSHDYSQAYDAKRTAFLNGRGFKVIRFTNEDVLDNLDGVLETIYLEAQTLAVPTPPLSPPARGGEPK